MVGRAGLLVGAATLALLAWPGEAKAQNSTEIVTASITERIVFTPPVVTVQRIDTFSTQIIGRLEGGILFDQTFPVAFTDPLAQGGVTAAMLAITTTGGPGVVIAAPVRTARTESGEQRLDQCVHAQPHRADGDGGDCDRLRPAQ